MTSERVSSILKQSLLREAAKYSRGRERNRLQYALEHHRNTEGQRLDFTRRPYLRALYEDRAQKIAVKKSVLCGVTEWAIVTALENAELGYSVLYVLQTQDKRTGFVADRIDKLFARVPHYRRQVAEAVGSADYVGMKHFGPGTIKFVGSRTQDEFTEFPADILIIDELDRCDRENILLAPDRLSASALKEEMRFSTPTVEGYGIDAEYADSDQKRWFIRCEACGKRQHIDWFRNVAREEDSGRYVPRDQGWGGASENGVDLRPVCFSCEKPLDRLGPGEWLAKKGFERHPTSGYHFSKLFTPPARDGERPIAKLWESFRRAQSNASAMQVFMNSDLGLAYTAEGAKLTEALLAACADPEHHLAQSGQDCTAGVDVGRVFHVRISKRADGKRIALYIGEVPTVEELDRLMGAYDVRCCVVDAQPETHLVKQFQARHPGRVFLCRYDRERLGDPKIDHQAGIVSYDRTQSLDASHADVLERRNILPAEFSTIDGGEYAAQMCAPTRVLDDRTGRYVWLEGSQADHHRHADNYDWIAGDLRTRGVGGGGWGAKVI